MIKNHSLYCQEIDNFIYKFIDNLTMTYRINSIFIIGSYAQKKGWRFGANDVDLLLIFNKNQLELKLLKVISKAFNEIAKNFRVINPILSGYMMQDHKADVDTVKTDFDLYFFYGDVEKEFIVKAYEYFRMKRIYGSEQQIKYIVIDKIYLKYFLFSIAHSIIPRTCITYECCNELKSEVKRLLHEAIKMSLSSIDPSLNLFTGDIFVDFINNFKQGKNIINKISLLDTSSNEDSKSMIKIINAVSENLAHLATNL